MTILLQAFIALFVAVDAPGVLPIFISLTQGLKEKERKKIILQSLLVAILLSVGFMFIGKAVFRFLGITVSDFMIAGGVLLFIIAVTDIVNPEKKRRIPTQHLGAVPLGTPLIAGHAVLATSLISIEHFGFYPTLFSVIANVFLAGL